MATVNVWCDKFFELEAKPEDLLTIIQALERNGVTVNIRSENPETLRWLSQLSADQPHSWLSSRRTPLLAGAALLSSLAMILLGVFAL